MEHYVISPARAQDLAALPAIELAAARLLAGHAPESVLAETTSLAALRSAQSQGRLWVALRGATPVGFAHVRLLEPLAVHLEEIDVHPDHGRRGIGSRLVRYVCDWAARQGHDCVTLTTFRHVPFNMPFYARLGFEVVAPSELTPALTAIVADEARRGLAPAARVAMRRSVRLSPASDRSAPNAVDAGRS